MKTNRQIQILLMAPVLSLLSNPLPAATQNLPQTKNSVAAAVVSAGSALVLPRQPDGSGAVVISGELKQWHKVMLTLDGPYADFDNTIALKKNVPLKSWSAHVQDWKSGDPTWKDGRGKGLIGALNYLSGKGANAFSFIPYNAGGDGDNVWPFIARDDKVHYDCSKLDQWQTVFDHATARGLYLHVTNRKSATSSICPEAVRPI